MRFPKHPIRENFKATDVQGLQRKSLLDRDCISFYRRKTLWPARCKALAGGPPVRLPPLLAALMNNTFFGDGQSKGGLGEMPSASRRDTVPCMHSGESGKCGQPVL